LKELVRRIATDEQFAAIAKGLSSAGTDQMVSGLAGSARHLYFAAMHHTLSASGTKPPRMLIVTHTMQAAQQVIDDLAELLPDVDILLYPERELAVADVLAYSPEVVASRLSVLQTLIAGRACIIVATIASACQPVMGKATLKDALLEYGVGNSVDVQAHALRLLAMGYEREELVERKGQFSVRGGILDIFPVTDERPVRIELFDTEVDSIRTFDPDSQRSLDKLDWIQVGPAMDFLIPAARMMEAAETVGERLEVRLNTTTDLETRDRLQSIVGEDIRRLQSGIPFYGQIRYTSVFQMNLSATLLDYFPQGTVMCLDEPTRLQERQLGLEREFTEWLSAAILRAEVLSGMMNPIDYTKFWQHKHWHAVHFSVFARPSGAHRFIGIHNIPAKTMQNFHGQMNVLKAEIARFQKGGLQVLLLAATKERAERLERVLADYRIDAYRSEELVDSQHPLILVANLTGGFELPLSKLAVIVETEVFTTRKKSRRIRSEMTDAERIKSYQELHTGDYVVHVNHGIGKYLGIQTLEIDGLHRDYLHLQYAGNDTLYVPVDQIDQVQRFVGSEEKVPKVYHLGGGEWTRVKQRVSKSVKDIAEDLVKLYASRQSTPGHAFSIDSNWQKDFESMFPYEETPDQLRAIDEIKRDMQKPQPMDRLLCGDVGYGKTEVAIRAAFKAVMDGKQVAVLVPTTVLAHQHFETFKERFAGFPVTIETLSRFRTKAEVNNVLTGLKDGSVDVVIGTHRLLHKNVVFKDLGLLIVDEEQRFGVTHKERLKQMRTNVDCLTLTATPIPRTLHMSLLGVRDLSVIETPPENRFPVQTYVVEWNESLLREAIERELSRGGQVYYLFNNVKSIRSMADRVARLVPEARVGVAHGQMAEDELERAMLDFLDGSIDVLVTTTIIETGLDIPNVNTLVVTDADKLGLSQLYQLRGRVGRSNRIAYAYFTYQKDKVLTEVAMKRLQAIKEFTELGSGFKIAMRDLSIRGAGNLLGAEQHGFINSVGFDLYNEMLGQAVKEIRGDVEPEPPEPLMDLSLEAFLPDDFISDPAQKIAMYKKFKFVRSLAGADDLEEELEDRYGTLPDAVLNLLDITRMKSYAVQYGLESITATESEAVIRVREDAVNRISHAELFSVSKQHQGQYAKRPNGTLQVSFRAKGLSDRNVCKQLLNFLADFKHALKLNEEVEQFAK
jgi:transcription-repair coupling factor (superfamily II helicase)